ncbi:MAG: glycosyltransferase family 2 protein [Propylenella sp.]
MPVEPLVSVIIPVHNRAAYLREAIDSVLSQTYRAIEVVVVDDGSTDGSVALAESIARDDPRVRTVRMQNEGPSAARNAGLDHARGEFICFLDADDWIMPDKIRRQMNALHARPDVDLVYSDFWRFKDADGTVLESFRGPPPVPFPGILVYRNWFGIMAPLFRRRLLERVGRFDTSLRWAEDWDFWYRCARHTEFLFEPGVLAMVRLHASQATRDDINLTRGCLRFAAKHFSADRANRRSNMAAFHLSRAIHFKQQGSYIRCAFHLLRFAASANSPVEARFVWNLVRWAPTRTVGVLGKDSLFDSAGAAIDESPSPAEAV